MPVNDQNPAITFVLAGPWQMPHPPEKYGLTLNQTSVTGVRWIGPREQSELIDWYKRATLFVMPSYYESFGISVVEAMAFGLPVVASDSGGLSEVIGSNGSGSIVPKRDPKAFADAIISSLWAGSTYAVVSVGSRERVCKMFTTDRVLTSTLGLYESVKRVSRSESP